MFDWLFEGIAGWVAKVGSQLLDAATKLFMSALGTDMLLMEEYFPFVSSAFTVMQYTAWALLFIITVWQLFKSFGGPLIEAEEPWGLVMRSSIFALLIYFAKPIFMYVLDIARAPYTALWELQMNAGDFSFSGLQGIIKNQMIRDEIGGNIIVVLLEIILLIALGWNYIKLLLEVIERYIVVGILCYTSPLAYSMGASKATSQVFKSWCRMVGSQLFMLVMNVWFLRAFNSSYASFGINGGVLSNGVGSIYLWLFCAIGFLKTAQRFDSYLASIGLNVAQTGGGLGMEVLMAARTVSNVGKGIARTAGNVFRGTTNAAGGISDFANKFKGNSYVRDSVVDGGIRMGAGGGIGFVGRILGGMAARNGATLNANSIASVANRTPNMSGRIGGDIADRSLANYMPHMHGKSLSETQISGGHISTTAVGADGSKASVELYNTSQFERPSGAHSVVTASDGTMWYQVASGKGAGEFYKTPHFAGLADEATQVSEFFPTVATGTLLRTVGEGQIAASNDEGETVWYSSAYYDEPSAPHDIIQSADGVDWYAMDPHASVPTFESGDEAAEYNVALFRSFMPGYEDQISGVESGDGQIEVQNADGSGMRFYDSTQYEAPRGEYEVYEDSNGNSWYGIHGEASVEKRPVYENGEPVYDGERLRTVNVPSVRYKTTPNAYDRPEAHEIRAQRAPNRKR